jgi:XTP/dITP diphosphohydrolase
MPELLFATNNNNKIKEIKAGLSEHWNIIGLQEAGINIEIPEPHQTLEENAKEKAWTIHQLTGLPCFSEDTGLEVRVLNGEPGVFSARYAGEQADATMNMDKLLLNMLGKSDRSARFRTVIALVWKGEIKFFEGICNGLITESPKGNNGFGYDPIFIPDGSDLHFGEMEMEQKNKFSHRKKALQQLLKYLQQNG